MVDDNLLLVAHYVLLLYRCTPPSRWLRPVGHLVRRARLTVGLLRRAAPIT